MDFILAMLADSAAKKIEERRWDIFPSSVERNVEASEYANYALYGYFVQNAILYPQEWVLNNYGAQVLASVKINGNEININDIKILKKTDGLSDDDIKRETTKTLNRASEDLHICNMDKNYPAQAITIEIPIEWRFMN